MDRYVLSFTCETTADADSPEDAIDTIILDSPYTIRSPIHVVCEDTEEEWDL